MVKSITDNEFEQEVLKANKPTLVDFWAPWCAPCRMLGPLIEQMAEKLGDEVNIFKMNVDENQEVPTRMGIRGIPTVVVFENGEIKEQLVGMQPPEAYLTALGFEVDEESS